MATFNSFTNILPDPSNPIGDAGEASPTGTPGPGFSAIGFQSITNTQVSRTISGRGVQRDGGSQHWEFTISYNPMFRYQFDPIDTFLLGRNPRRDPFYVILPQHARPKDPTFANFMLSNSVYTSGYSAGASVMDVTSSSTIQGLPKSGDVFTITDPLDFNHQKAYKITGVETPTTYQNGTAAPGANVLRLHFAPPLTRNLKTQVTLNFINPKFRVISKSDVQEYALNTDNLYSFSLAVEEIMP